LESVVGSVTKHRYKRGELILQKGKTTQTLYMLVIGSAHVTMKAKSGKEVILATVEAGDYLGEMSLLDGKPHSADVMAAEMCDVLILGRSQLLSCMRDSEEVSLALLKGLVERLREADEKIASLALKDVYARVAKALMDMALKTIDGSRRISEKISKQTLAKRIGASREMVTRVFNDFEKNGDIEWHSDGSLQLHDKLATVL
jgi:CRP-like cAMP-binding protein